MAQLLADSRRWRKRQSRRHVCWRDARFVFAAIAVWCTILIGDRLRDSSTERAFVAAARRGSRSPDVHAAAGKSPRGRLPDLKEIGLKSTDLPSLDKPKKKVVVPTGPPPELDEDAVQKYAIAIVSQIIVCGIIFFALDANNFSVGLDQYTVFGIFYALGIVQNFGLLSPLDRFKNWDAKDERLQPQWKPQTEFFLFMYIFVLTPARAAASTEVFQKVGHFFDAGILVYVFHLALDSTWQTVSNYEKRSGAAVPGALLCLLSCVLASLAYYVILPLAGQSLAPTAIWYVTVLVLTINTWSMNNEGGQEPPYPYKGKITSNYWFNTLFR